MTTLIFGVGIGLFLILSLWAIATLIFVVSLRIERKVGAIAILVVSVCTLVLITLPRAAEKPNTIETRIYDHLFIWRILLLILLIISSIVGLAGYIKLGLTEPIRATRITSWAS